MQIAKVEQIAGNNHAVSAQKFQIIKAFLELGWNVLLSDIDVVVLKVSPSPCCGTRSADRA